MFGFKQFSFIFLLLISSFVAYTQQTLVSLSPTAEFDKARALFESEKYVPAQHHFSNVINQLKDRPCDLRVEAEYYHAVCAVNLFNVDAEYLVSKFIEQNPGSLLVNHAYFEMGRAKYRNEKFQNAVEWLSKVDRYYLNTEESAEWSLKMGHSLFMRKKYNEARVYLFEILNQDTKHAIPAIYYYSHIAYDQKNYQTSLNGFMRIKEDETFKTLVPYYITHIYYFQKKFDDIIQYAPPLLDSMVEKRKPEVARIIGEAFYEKLMYDTALYYFDIFMKGSKNLTAADKYRLAYANYRMKRYDVAAGFFEDIANDTTALSQNALVHLGDCYIKLNQKDKARLAFGSASRLDADPVLRRDAHLNYALVTFELSYSPFNDAIESLSSFVKLYPASDKTDVAYKYLVLAYTNTRNYKDALASIENVKERNEDLAEAYQRITYYRALEFYTDGDMVEALTLLNKSINAGNYNKTIKPLAYFWKAEILNRQTNYDEAIINYNQFFGSAGVLDRVEYPDAVYGIAYATFNKKLYTESVVWFRKFIDYKVASAKKKADAFNRIGDCYYVKTDYVSALDFYDRSIKLAAFEPDYATFQKAFTLGVQNKHMSKIETLRTLLSIYPISEYCDDACFELGDSWLDLGNNDSAVARYKMTVIDYPQSFYVPQALVQLGLINYNQEKLKEALSYYTQVLDNYKGSDEERSAVGGIKNIYLAMNDADGYVSFMKNLNREVSVSIDERDSMTYFAAQNVYMKGKFDQAVSMFDDYLQAYPQGAFKVNARYYKGDCLNRTGKQAEAASDFNGVLADDKSMFTEEALLNSARYSYKQKDYAKALEYYIRLENESELKTNITEAIHQQMRCYVQLKQTDSILRLAVRLLNEEKITTEMKREAHFNIAAAWYEKNDMEKALSEYILVSHEVRSVEGAESKFRVAEIFLKQAKIKKCKKEVYDFIELNSSHRYWLAKAFIVLADAFVAEKDDFQAIHTLRSVMENYEDKTDGILEEASAKEKELLAKEENKNLISTSTDKKE